MKILFLGDVVGEPGRKICRHGVPALRAHWDLNLVIANAENAAGGSGINARCLRQLEAAGIDGFTMGDHVYKKADIFPLFEERRPLCRPANFPSEAPGPDRLLLETPLGPVAVICVLGRLFMRPVDCPFKAMDRVLESLPPEVKVIIVDMHAEATSEKQLMLRHLQGRVTGVFGTHTHVPTADAAVFPPGTAYITDAGMTGPYDGVIGRRSDRVLHTTLSFEPSSFDVATGDPRISGVVFEVDATTGKAISCELAHFDKSQLDALAAPEQAPVDS